MPESGGRQQRQRLLRCRCRLAVLARQTLAQAQGTKDTTERLGIAVETLRNRERLRSQSLYFIEMAWTHPMKRRTREQQRALAPGARRQRADATREYRQPLGQAAEPRI